MLGAALEDLATAGRTVTELLGSGPDPDLMATAAWSVRQVAVHLVAGAGMYSACLRGQPSPLQDMRPNTLSAFNRGAFVALTERDVRALALLHQRALVEVEAAALEGTAVRNVPFHAGHERPVEWMVTAMATEQLLHGWDIARAIGVDWRPRAALSARLSAFFAHMAPSLYRGEKATIREGSYWISPEGGDGWGFDLDGDQVLPRTDGLNARCRVAGDGFELMLWTSRRAYWKDLALTASGEAADLAAEVMGSFYAA